MCFQFTLANFRYKRNIKDKPLGVFYYWYSTMAERVRREKTGLVGVCVHNTDMAIKIGIDFLLR